MRILVASDKFKGSLTALEACEAIREGLCEALGESTGISVLPVADGGDGMSRAIVDAKQGEWRTATVSGPLGEPVEAGYGTIDGCRCAVIEMAEASGLWRIGTREKDPWSASTFGTGQLIAQAVNEGAGSVLLGIGGSATNDGGSGLARALGFGFLDSGGEPVEEIPARLTDVVRLTAPATPLPARVTVACDVTNPLLGPEGCTRIYGPQKGIEESAFERHEARLRHLLALLGEEAGSLAGRPGSGAAGGLGFGCLAFLGAELKPGFTLVAEVLDLEAAIRDADLVITGEGKLDGQSLFGKAPAGVAAMARRHGKTTVAFCGIRGEGDLGDLFDAVYEIDRGTRTVEQSMRDGVSLLRTTARGAAARLVALRPT